MRSFHFGLQHNYVQIFCIVFNVEISKKIEKISKYLNKNNTCRGAISLKVLSQKNSTISSIFDDIRSYRDRNKVLFKNEKPRRRSK